jgi:two-component system chemotaxis response regulator CheB
VRPGRALVAPGNRHLVLHRHGGGFRVGVTDGPLVSRHRPSVDVLFRCVAAAAGSRAVGVVLTGMGADGADGARHIRLAEGTTLAQDEASCVVLGMPKEAILRGGVDEVVPLDVLPAVLLRAAAEQARRASSRAARVAR